MKRQRNWKLLHLQRARVVLLLPQLDELPLWLARAVHDLSLSDTTTKQLAHGVAWGPNGLFIFLVSLGNLVPRAATSHKWYLDTFPEYAALGRAKLIPGVW